MSVSVVAELAAALESEYTPPALSDPAVHPYTLALLRKCGVPEDNTRYLVENYVPSDQITYVGVFVKWHKAKQPTLLPDDWPRYLALQSAARFPPGDLPLGLLPASADESSGVGGTITPGLCNIRRIQQCSTAQPVETHNVAVY